MIYTRDGTPYSEAWPMIVLRKAELLAERAQRQRQRVAANADGSAAYIVRKDKLGAPYKIFRGVHT